jgi:hypothetical protein
MHLFLRKAKLFCCLLREATLLLAVTVLIEDNVTFILDEAALGKRAIECSENWL